MNNHKEILVHTSHVTEDQDSGLRIEKTGSFGGSVKGLVGVAIEQVATGVAELAIAVRLALAERVKEGAGGSIEVEFSVGFSAEGSLFVAKTGGEGSIAVRLHWQG